MNNFTLIHSDSFSPGTDQEHSASRETGCDPNDTLNYTQMHSHTHSHPVIGRPLGGSARSDRTYLGAGLWELWEQIQAGRSLWSVFIHDSAGGSSYQPTVGATWLGQGLPHPPLPPCHLFFLLGPLSIIQL